VLFRSVPAVIIRLRNLFSVDFEGTEALHEAVAELERSGTTIFISGVASHIEKELLGYPTFKTIKEKGYFTTKTSDAIAMIKK